MISIRKTNHGYQFEVTFNRKKYKVTVSYNQVLNYLTGFYYSIFDRLKSSEWRI